MVHLRLHMDAKSKGGAGDCVEFKIFMCQHLPVVMLNPIVFAIVQVVTPTGLLLSWSMFFTHGHRKTRPA